jgi:hypothetical protein
MDLTGLTERKRGEKSTWYEDVYGEVVAKVCKKCFVAKSIEEYAKHKRGLGGRESACKVCRFEYRKTNKERKTEYMRNYYVENRGKCNDRSRKYYNENREHMVKYYRAWREHNKDRKVKTNRKHYEANKERYAELRRLWKSNNPDKIVLLRQRRRAQKSVLPDDLTTTQMEAILKHFGGCALTKSSENINWEHALPLAIGHGGTTYGNMYPMSERLNFSKGKKNIFEWFVANRDRFGLKQAKFDALIEYLANINEMTIDEYRDYVYWCHANPRTIEELTELNATGNRSTDDNNDRGNGQVGEVS